MRIAALYVRVSTDEQAEKGYSQRNQEEVLRRYCELKSIQVGKVYYEEHSAKTFNRPVWKKILLDLRKSKGDTDVILFTKWDRFSRNTGDAYSMLNTLRRFGVDAQAIEQPLDLEVPENKMMLAFYLAAPEVENDRRGLNIFHGIRRAKKEGRWPAAAPVGYVNLVDEKGHKYIAPKEPEASAMRKAFQEVAAGKYTLREIYNQARKEGITCLYNNFCHIIRNPVYCGKVLVPKYKDEEEFLADGQHEALIPESLYYQVQDRIDGRKRIEGIKFSTDDRFLLRGFLECPKCDRKLTASASKGRKFYYYYYHCSSACGARYKAEDLNKCIDKKIKEIGIKEEYEQFYHQVLLKAYKDSAGIGDLSQRAMLNNIKELQLRLERSRNLYLDDKLEEADYKKAKRETENEIISLEKRLPDVIKASRSVADNLNCSNLEPK